MTSKHTPGPWILAETVENRFQKTDMRRVRAEHEGTEHGAVCEVYGVRDGSTAAANARLIAAAPELLEALKRLLGATDAGNAETHDLGCRCVIHEARAAISRATR
jgi:hypothetical protein